MQETSGPITEVALASVGKFLLYGFITRETLNGEECINRIAAAVTECRFEATDRSSYEV